MRVSVRRARQDRAKCESPEIARDVTERKAREEGIARTCVCTCVCMRGEGRGEDVCLCRTKGKSGRGGRAGWQRGMGSVLITSTDFNGGFLYAVYFVHDLYYFEPRWSSARSI